ncbi:hypothetical protein NYR66_02030 [Actinobacillus equuli subsp. haemolyticus]|uniref:hypothetical protein n=1 Tax=Actinobacillus equuli TaxID=718 RepID=UPI002442B525|nr:hypothetical protein [Actinobacillus equuli]WGE81792.1 hypothetical protein NYR66_02030 [Actinobacillus equuli subsp. haemolyticus]
MKNKKFVVMQYLSIFNEWTVTVDTQRGVSRSAAEAIRYYRVRYKNQDPNKIIVVEVPEI